MVIVITVLAASLYSSSWTFCRPMTKNRRIRPSCVCSLLQQLGTGKKYPLTACLPSTDSMASKTKTSSHTHMVPKLNAHSKHSQLPKHHAAQHHPNSDKKCELKWKSLSKQTPPLLAGRAAGNDNNLGKERENWNQVMHAMLMGSLNTQPGQLGGHTATVPGP